MALQSAGPTFALGMTKVQIYNEWDLALPAAIEAEAQAQALCMLTSDFEEGYRAFKEKGILPFTAGKREAAVSFARKSSAIAYQGWSRMPLIPGRATET